MINRISGKIIGLAFLILPLTGIKWLSDLLGNSIIQSWKVISVLVLCVLLINRRKIRFDKFALSVLLYYAFMIFGSIIHSGFDLGPIFTYSSMIVLVVYIANDIDNVLSAFLAVGIVSIVANFYTLLTIQENNEFASVYFLGGKNTFSMFFIPILSIYFYQIYTKNKKISVIHYWLLILCTVSSFLANSATGIIVMVCYIGLLILSFTKIYRNKVLFIIIMALNGVLLFGQLFLSNIQIYNVILNSLGKNATLTNRTLIWQRAIELIKLNPLFGNGGTVQFFGEVTECHNGFLQILFDSGIVGLILFINYFIRVLSERVEHNNGSRFLFVGVLAMCFNALTESMFEKTLFVALIAICYYSSLQRKQIS